jgi:threonine aldolase
MEHMIIDLRSDTVTRPSQEMRNAMAAAEVGDDVYGEDPTVNRLQERIAGILGKEAALFVASGSMGNQLCIKTHTQPGDEVIAERNAHVFQYETGGAAFLSGVQIHTVEAPRGILSAGLVLDAIRPDIYYMPRTRLVCIENTHNRAGGTIYPIPVIEEIADAAREQKLKMHLDGARLWNASVASGIAPSTYAKHFDSVSVCLSKGLGAPVGSVIAGKSEFINSARHFRKIFGGGMRQAGVLAAAGLFALDHNIDRLQEDHAKARLLAEAIAQVKGCSIDLEGVQTNIVIVDFAGTGWRTPELIETLKKRGILVGDAGKTRIRLVTHLDAPMDLVRTAAKELTEVFARNT